MAEKSSKKALLRKVFTDSMWSVAGLVLMNAVAQFVIYPIWNRELGNDLYGRIIYLIAGMNILAVSMGVSCNYARMKASAGGKTGNGTYSRILLITSAGLIPYCLVVALLAGGPGFSAVEAILLILLAIATMWRFYADVEYRLSLNYRGCFVYYLVISLGYGVGIGLFLWTKLWPLALLPGELAGLALIYLRGTVLRKAEEPESKEEQKAITRMVMTLFVTEIISNLIANGDRVMLNLAMGGTAVTIYYQASLAGKTMTLVTTPLNSVLIGYLARYKKGLDRRIMRIVLIGAVAAMVIATGICVLGSHILIKLLYPQNYDLVKPYFLTASIAQVSFFVSGVAATVLLRFCKTRYQLYINLVYAGLYAALCIPGMLLWQLDGLCAGMMLAGVLKLCYVIWLGYRSIGKGEQDDPEGSAGQGV